MMTTTTTTCDAESEGTAHLLVVSRHSLWPTMAAQVKRQLRDAWRKRWVRFAALALVIVALVDLLVLVASREAFVSILEKQVWLALTITLYVLTGRWLTFLHTLFIVATTVYLHMRFFRPRGYPLSTQAYAMLTFFAVFYAVLWPRRAIVGWLLGRAWYYLRVVMACLCTPFCCLWYCCCPSFCADDDVSLEEGEEEVEEEKKPVAAPRQTRRTPSSLH